VTVVWPESLPLPPLPAGAAAEFVRRPAATPRARTYYAQWGLRKDVRRHGIDIIHYPASVGSVLPPRPMILTVHDLTFLHNPAWYRYERAHDYRRAAKYTAPRAARIIAVSQATANEVTGLLGIPPERIDVIHNGVDERYAPCSEEQIRAARAKYQLPQRYFLFVGTIEPRKNVARLVRAWSQVAGHVEEDLVIAGRDGWKVGPIYQEVGRSKYQDRIVFPGYIEDEHLPAVICGATALAYPSLYEGFGLPVLEAMACGVPVLTSNVSSLPEVAGEAALLVDPANMEAMMEGLTQLAGRPDLRDDLIRKGLERAKQFTWTRAAQETLACYRKAMDA
ncbi:MAG: glycosyltransferase family 4 protein, partial [Candidatus Hydrogenedentes bacterium]|nr:glycosyltransferase family 4 protein [Candidatus Hydrogenedentota bacterium]